MRRALLTLLLLALACAARSTVEQGPLIAEDGPSRPSQRNESPRTHEVTAAAAPLSVGVIGRSDLVKVLDLGPARFFGQLQLRARLHKRRFVGWEVVSFQPHDQRMASVDLLPGDVVHRINGGRVSRPEQFQEVWDSLRFARRLHVDFTRAGQRRELVFAIEN